MTDVVGLDDAENKLDRVEHLISEALEACSLSDLRNLVIEIESQIRKDN